MCKHYSNLEVNTYHTKVNRSFAETLRLLHTFYSLILRSGWYGDKAFKCWVIISYIKMKVCVCVCVCVCPAACRRTHTTYHPEIRRGLLISPWLGTEPGADPKCWPPGVPPIVTLSVKPWRVKNWVGAGKQKLLLGWVCHVKFYLWGAHPNLGPAGSTLPNGGVCFKNWAGVSKQKVLLGVGLYIKILFVGGSPQPKARTGLFQDEIV